jgi:small subunit ribosomal protein S17
MESGEKKIKRILQGEVVSDKMDKTVVVKVERTFKHPYFAKILRRHKKYKVHDEQEVARPGDIVEFSEGRPLSKTKYMYLVRVLTSRAR